MLCRLLGKPCVAYSSGGNAVSCRLIDFAKGEEEDGSIFTQCSSKGIPDPICRILYRGSGGRLSLGLL